MAEENWDPSNPWILNKMIDISERVLDSHESANVLIIVLIVLAVIAIVGVGFLLTYAAAPVYPAEILH